MNLSNFQSTDNSKNYRKNYKNKFNVSKHSNDYLSNLKNKLTSLESSINNPEKLNSREWSNESSELSDKDSFYDDKDDRNEEEYEQNNEVEPSLEEDLNTSNIYIGENTSRLSKLGELKKQLLLKTNQINNRSSNTTASPRLSKSPYSTNTFNSSTITHSPSLSPSLSNKFQTNDLHVNNKSYNKLSQKKTHNQEDSSMKRKHSKRKTIEQVNDNSVSDEDDQYQYSDTSNENVNQQSKSMILSNPSKLKFMLNSLKHRENQLKEKEDLLLKYEQELMKREKNSKPININTDTLNNKNFEMESYIVLSLQILDARIQQLETQMKQFVNNENSLIEYIVEINKNYHQIINQLSINKSVDISIENSNLKKEYKTAESKKSNHTHNKIIEQAVKKENTSKNFTENAPQVNSRIESKNNNKLNNSDELKNDTIADYKILNLLNSLNNEIHLYSLNSSEEKNSHSVKENHVLNNRKEINEIVSSKSNHSNHSNHSQLHVNISNLSRTSRALWLESEKEIDKIQNNNYQIDNNFKNNTPIKNNLIVKPKISDKLQYPILKDQIDNNSKHEGYERISLSSISGDSRFSISPRSDSATPFSSRGNPENNLKYIQSHFQSRNVNSRSHSSHIQENHPSTINSNRNRLLNTSQYNHLDENRAQQLIRNISNDQRLRNSKIDNSSNQENSFMFSEKTLPFDESISIMFLPMHRDCIHCEDTLSEGDLNF